MYKLMAIFSLVIRNFVLPNPFEHFPVPVSALFGVDIVIPSILLNMLIEPFLHAITFSVVGLYYKKGVDSPAKGSFLYLFFYCLHVAMLYIMSVFEFSLFAVIFLIIAYIVIQIIDVLYINLLRSM